jgi:hypothetical protein
MQKPENILQKYGNPVFLRTSLPIMISTLGLENATKKLPQSPKKNDSDRSRNVWRVNEGNVKPPLKKNDSDRRVNNGNVKPPENGY